MVSDSSNMAQNFAIIEWCDDDHGGRSEQDLIDRRGSWSASQRANSRSKIGAVGCIYLLSRFGGAGKCVSFYCSFHIRSSCDDSVRSTILAIIPGSASLIPV